MTTETTDELMTPAAYEARIFYACRLVDHLNLVEPGKLTSEQRDRLQWAIGEIEVLKRWGESFLTAAKVTEKAMAS